jgi:hypothetical protein
MVFGIISVVTGAVGAPLSMVSLPISAASTSTSVIGVAQGVAGHQNSQETSGPAAAESSGPDLANDPRLAKFTLTAHCDAHSSVRDQVDNKQVVLRNGKVRTCHHHKLPCLPNSSPCSSTSTTQTPRIVASTTGIHSLASISSTHPRSSPHPWGS